jgi:hypothetical protein
VSYISEVVGIWERNRSRFLSQRITSPSWEGDKGDGSSIANAEILRRKLLRMKRIIVGFGIIIIRKDHRHD